MRLVDAWILSELLDDMHRNEEEAEPGGELIYVLIGGIIGGAMLLDALGIAPGQTWAFLKALTYPSTWDVQIGADMSYFNSAITMFSTGIGVGIGGTILILICSYIVQISTRRVILPFAILLFLVLVIFKIAEKSLIGIMVVNLAILCARFFWYAGIGFLSFLFSI